MTDDKILETQGLSVHFGGVRAVDDVDLAVRRGQVLGLIGPNGAGKTTMLNLITGVYAPSAGTVFLNGSRIDGMAPHEIVRAGVARTFQNIRLFNSLTVMEHLHLALRQPYSGWKSAVTFTGPANDGHATVVGSLRETLMRFDLWESRNRKAAELPYGPQRRLELVRALALKPQVLLLDEPTAGMNDDETMEIADSIKLLSEHGLAVLLIEHNMPFVNRTCDRVTVINFGKHVTEGTPQEIRRHPEVLEAYLGEDDS